MDDIVIFLGDLIMHVALVWSEVELIKTAIADPTGWLICCCVVWGIFTLAAVIGFIDRTFF